MKKLIYTAALLFSVTGVMAQSQVQGPKGHPEAPGTPKITSMKKNIMGKADVQEWYEPFNWLYAKTGQGATLETFVQFLMPDSLAAYIDENDTTRRFYGIAVGQVIDPKDDIIDLDNPGIRMSQWSGYTVDSFYLQYLYVRNVDSFDNPVTMQREKVVDTLVVTYLTSDHLRKSTLQPSTGSNYIATVPSANNWNINTLQLTSFAGQEKFILTDADSTVALAGSTGTPESSWRTKIMSKKVGPTLSIPKNANNFFAIVYQFKLGMPHDENSVMIYQSSQPFPSGKQRTNYFGYRFASNNADASGQWRSMTYSNNSLMSLKQNAYYASDVNINNGWGGFIAGNAYFEGQTVISGAFLNATGVGMKESDLISISSVFPNPATSQTTVNFNLKKSGTVSISILNIVGQEVASVNAGNLVAGNNSVVLDVNTLKAGVYFVNVTIDGVSTTQKLTIGR